MGQPNKQGADPQEEELRKAIRVLKYLEELFQEEGNWFVLYVHGWQDKK